MTTNTVDEVWTTKDGRKVAVGAMEEAHVRDALRMIIRNVRKRQEHRAAIFRLSSELGASLDDDRKWGRD